jgi:bacteriocin-like protein
MSDTKKTNKPLPKLRPILTEEELAKVMGGKGTAAIMEPPETSKSTGDTGTMGCPG